MKLAVLGLLTSLVACGACGDAPAPQSARDAKVEAAGPRRIALLFEARRPGTRPFPFPYVEVKVGLQTARFMVDTGAAVHAVDRAFLAKTQLASPVKAASLAIAGWGNLPEGDVKEVDLPESTRTHGIDGILSPQRLTDASGQAVVLDLVAKELRRLARSTAWSQIDDLGPKLTAPTQQYCAVAANGFTGRTVIVDGLVDGVPTKLIVDTGLGRSVLLGGSPAGVRASARPVIGRSIAPGATSEVPVTIQGAVPLAIGAWSSSVDLGTTPGTDPSQCGDQGWLGMDVLQHCAIAFTSDEVALSCRASAR